MLDALLLGRRRAEPYAAVSFALAHPIAQRLGRAAEIAGNDSIAAHCEAYWSLASKGHARSHSCTSGVNIQDLLITAPISIDEASKICGDSLSSWATAF